MSHSSQLAASGGARQGSFKMLWPAGRCWAEEETRKERAKGGNAKERDCRPIPFALQTWCFGPTWSDLISQPICVQTNVFAVTLTLIVKVMTHKGQVFKTMTDDFGNKNTKRWGKVILFLFSKSVRTTWIHTSTTEGRGTSCWLRSGTGYINCVLKTWEKRWLQVLTMFVRSYWGEGLNTYPVRKYSVSKCGLQ